MRIDQFDLRDLLNYDTHTKKIFTYDERIALHKAVGKALNGFGFELSNKLMRKVKEVFVEMELTEWEAVTGRYVEDSTTHEIKFIKIK